MVDTVKRLLLLGVLGFFSFTALGQTVIISEYAESCSGSSPKTLELWNPTNTDIDLSSTPILIEKQTNASTSWTLEATINTGFLKAGEVIVISSSSFLSGVTTNCATTVAVTLTHNGDDAYRITLGSTVTDIFGDTSAIDPGTSWTGSGVQTHNGVIEIKTGITTGTTAGWTDPSIRFQTVGTVGNCSSISGFGIPPGGCPSSSCPTTVQIMQDSTDCDSVQINNIWYSVSTPNVKDTIRDIADACDSIIYTYNIVINKTFEHKDTTVMSSSFTTPSGKSIMADGIVTDSLKTINTNCDSIIEYDVTFTSCMSVTPLASRDTASCDSVLIAGTWYKNSISPIYDTLKDMAGNCDSIIYTYNVIVNSASHTQIDTILVGATSFTTPGGKTISSTGVISDSLKNSTNCDSIIAYNVVFTDTLGYVIDFDTASFWTQGVVGLGSYATDHVYSDKGWTFTGGDALREQTGIQDGHLRTIGEYAWRVRNTANSYLEATFTGSSVRMLTGIGLSTRHWDGTPTANYTLEFSHDAGSTWTTFHNISSTNSYYKSTTFTPPFPLFASPVAITPNQFKVRIVNNGGGERLMIDNFTFDFLCNTVTPMAAIDSMNCDSVMIADNWYYSDTNGVYDTLKNVAGICDSIIYTYNVKVSNSYFTHIDTTVLRTFTSPNGKMTTIDAIVTDSLLTISNCDSIIEYNVTVITIDTMVTKDALGTTLTVNQGGAMYQWIDCDNANTPIAGATSQSYTATQNGNYAVIVTLNGLTDTSACVNVNTSGIDEIEKAININIFPNPSKGQFNISITDNVNIKNIKILDISGKLILEQKEIYFDTKLNKGMFFIIVTTESNKQIIEKIIIN